MVLPRGVSWRRHACPEGQEGADAIVQRGRVGTERETGEEGEMVDDSRTGIKYMNGVFIFIFI